MHQTETRAMELSKTVCPDPAVQKALKQYYLQEWPLGIWDDSKRGMMFSIGLAFASGYRAGEKDTKRG